MAKTLAGLALRYLLSGCAGMNGSGNQSAIDANFVQLGACIKSVDNLPEYAVLLPHTSNRQLVELTDDRLPTPEEARLIVARGDAKAPCRQSFVAAFARPPINRPDAAQIWSAAQTEGLQLTAHFARREMTWGQFASAQQSLLAAARARLSEADQQQAAAGQARAALALGFISHMQQQQQDRSINCTSMRMGNMVSTNCN